MDTLIRKVSENMSKVFNSVSVRQISFGLS